jgi:sterol desaturase/sphingolipid hydroxylase (fatty acid hydroxylase superfamily)
MSFDEPTAQLVRALAPLGAFVFGLAFERLAPHTSLRPAWTANLGLWLIDAVLMAVVCGACGFAIAEWAAHGGIGLLNEVGAPLWLGILVTVAALDLLSYAWHRANHEIGFLWRFHRVHHADAAFHVSTALRFHPGELLLALPIRLGVIVLLGAPALGVVLFEALFGIANVLVHGNFDLARRVERLLGVAFVTPALHRKHHSTERSDRDSNYGTIFNLWDRAARTLRPNTSAARFATGLAEPAGVRARSLAAMLVAPLRPR